MVPEGLHHVRDRRRRPTASPSQCTEPPGSPGRHLREEERSKGLTEYLDEMVRFQDPRMESGSAVHDRASSDKNSASQEPNPSSSTNSTTLPRVGIFADQL